MPETATGQVDLAIRGGGPVGCVLALALRDSGLRVRLVGPTPKRTAVDPAARSTFRPLALSYASRLILERVGAWEGLATTAIDTIHVSQSGGFGRTNISRQDLELPALGYVADYDVVAAHLASLVDAGLRVPEDQEAPQARLLVHAEGTTGDAASGKDYGHTAIVAALESDCPPHGVAWERFTPEGPVALLPMKGHYGLVWSRIRSAATALMALHDEAFLDALQAAFGGRAGRFLSIGPRFASPLILRYRAGPAVPGELHIGNAAQTLHPVAGQGLNLGLRDAWDLASRLRSSSPELLASRLLTRQFMNARRLDARGAILATDLMATLFTRPGPLSSVLRATALTALDVFPPARKFFARRMIYGASAW